MPGHIEKLGNVPVGAIMSFSSLQAIGRQILEALCPMSKGEFNRFVLKGYVRAVVDGRGLRFCGECIQFLRLVQAPGQGLGTRIHREPNLRAERAGAFQAARAPFSTRRRTQRMRLTSTIRFPAPGAGRTAGDRHTVTPSRARHS